MKAGALGPWGLGLGQGLNRPRHSLHSEHPGAWSKALCFLWGDGSMVHSTTQVAMPIRWLVHLVAPHVRRALPLTVTRPQSLYHSDLQTRVLHSICVVAAAGQVCRLHIMTSGAPAEPTTTGYAPNESRRAAALPTRVEEPFARQYVGEHEHEHDPHRASRSVTDRTQATTARQRPVGCFAPAASAQVCSCLHWFCSITHSSACEKLSSSTRLAFREPHGNGLPSLLYHSGTALGQRGMVQPTSCTIPRDSVAFGLGGFTAVCSVSYLSDSNASRKRSESSFGLLSVWQRVARSTATP